MHLISLTQAFPQNYSAASKEPIKAVLLPSSILCPSALSTLFFHTYISWRSLHLNNVFQEPRIVYQI